MPEVFSRKKLFPVEAFAFCCSVNPPVKDPRNPDDPCPEFIPRTLFWYEEEVETGGAVDVVIRTAAAATVEQPGLFRVKTDSTSAKGAEFIAELFPPPDNNQDTDEELFGERLRPENIFLNNIQLVQFKA